MLIVEAECRYSIVTTFNETVRCNISLIGDKGGIRKHMVPRWACARATMRTIRGVPLHVQCGGGSSSEHAG